MENRFSNFIRAVPIAILMLGCFIIFFAVIHFIVSECVNFLNWLPHLDDKKDNCEWNKDGGTDFVSIPAAMWLVILLSRKTVSDYKDRTSLVTLVFISALLFSNIFLRFYHLNYPIFLFIFNSVVGYFVVFIESDARYVGGKFR